MLRAFVLMLGCLLAGAGASLWLCGIKGPGIQALLFGAVIVCGVVFERWRYKRLEGESGGNWEPTGERFCDPQTGASVEVFYNARTGERRYSKSVS